VGHLDVKGLRHATTGLPIDSVLIKNCRICALANIKRFKFPNKAKNHAEHPLFRIHSDICGPLPIIYGSFRYFITFIDDYSHFISIYFLKYKSDTLQCFHEFRTAAEKFLGHLVVFLRIENLLKAISVTTARRTESPMKNQSLTHHNKMG
jgi:hypothetical protein